MTPALQLIDALVRFGGGHRVIGSAETYGSIRLG
jgi:hypothetical protein